MFTILQHILNLIAPPRRTERVVSAMTLDDLYNLQTSEGLPYHNDSVAALVWELKYYANPRAAALAGALLADEVVMLASEEVGRVLLVPVPMHQARRRERGHNQTEVLCKSIIKKLGEAFLDYTPTALVRMRSTPQQQGLPKHKRLKNVHGSMIADKNIVRERVCIVVDDVSTTGATLAEAARALKAAGARGVHTVALAKS